VKAPRSLRIDGDMLISQVEYTLGPEGEMTRLHLVRPDAFTPEPETASRRSRQRRGLWKELKNGAK
jgi:prophage tail gpP-like protein